MAVQKGKRDFRDEVRLDLSDRHQVQYWCKRWGVTPDQLTAASREAGLLVKDVAYQLGKKK
jgi:hypothetical protein